MWWTLAAASIGSCSALLIAFVAYPWQKRKDRQQQLLHEKRDAYRRFSEEANGYFARIALGAKIHDLGQQQEHYLRVVAVSSDLIIYAPKEVIESCQRYSQTLFEFSDVVGFDRGLVGYTKKKSILDRKSLYKEVKQMRRAAMIAIRKDLADKKNGEATDAVSAYFVLTPMNDHEE